MTDRYSGDISQLVIVERAIPHFEVACQLPSKYEDFNMLSGVCIGTNDMAKAAGFYDAVFATIGMKPAFKG
ncbi:hypothetical protein [Labrenzia sp. R4_2]|uniref:hypothetical protein n=1 Tax=Labrenzia sp. R4_2 TaxID=2821107 RepID=UPI0025700B23|nr:hypothetical protein [Labrenzia sp. R4_2]